MNVLFTVNYCLGASGATLLSPYATLCVIWCNTLGHSMQQFRGGCSAFGRGLANSLFHIPEKLL